MGRGRSQKSLNLVQAAYEILDEIRPATIRAVCYQLFIRGVISGMDKASTNRVSALITHAREEGVIPWEWIVQEGREIEGRPSWDDPAAFAPAVQALYLKNKWVGQPKRITIVSEKGTVRGTLAPVLDELALDFVALGGYASATRVRELAQAGDPDQPLLLLYLGDHDPSGRSMSDLDLPQRLWRYAGNSVADKRLAKSRDAGGLRDDLTEVGLEVRRIALTIEDTEDLGGAVAFPADDKRDDPRHDWFVATHGSLCWELDALSPNGLRARVRSAVLAEIDRPAWDRYVAAEQAERASIIQTLRSWSSISGLAQK